MNRKFYLTWALVIAVPVIVYLLNRAWLAELIECVEKGMC